MGKDDKKKQDDKEQGLKEDQKIDQKQADASSEKSSEEKKNKEAAPFQQKIADLESQLEASQNQVKRVLADYQNLEKRVFQERQMWIRTANKEMILRILPVLDTLMMAGKHVKDQGLQLSIQQFISALKNEGIEKIETEGKEFDPYTMECVETVDGEDNKVVEELRAGFKMQGYVLRPAQVKVGSTKQN